MIKRILYVILVIVIIVIITIMWKQPKKEDLVITNQDGNTTTQVEETAVKVDTSTSINNELDNMNINSGIEVDLNSMNKDLETL